MPVLVTGGQGFIGSHVAEALAREGHDVVVVDNLDPYYDPALKAYHRAAVEAAAKDAGVRATFEKGDIADRAFVNGVFERHAPEYVFHEAAQAGVRPSLVDPFKYMRVNVDGTLALLEAARAAGNVARFVNASSSSVYGKAVYTPFDEKHPTEPVSPYGASKLAAEHLVRIYQEVHDLRTVSLRYFTVYGPRMRPDMAISNFTARAIAGKPPVIYGDGNAVRDFTYVEDVVRLNLRLLDTDAADGRVLNVGSGGVITVRELADHILTLAGADVEPVHEPAKAGDAALTHANAGLARELLGIAPEVSIRDGVARFVAWYKENPWYQEFAREAALRTE